MSQRALSYWFLGLALLTAIAGVVLYAALHLDWRAQPKGYLVSFWRDGKRIARTVVNDGPESALRDNGALRGSTRVIEEIVDSRPVLSTSHFLFGVSFVPGRDGIEAIYGDRRAFASPDDLLKQHAYDASFQFGGLAIKFGVDPEIAFDYLARELAVSRAELLSRAQIRRVALRKRPIEDETATRLVSRDNLRSAVIGAARYLARAVGSDGRYRYETDAATGVNTDDYNWPRHAGATWYLADAAAYSQDPQITRAALAAADYMVNHAVVDCGEHRCVAEGERADFGSSALGLLGISELSANPNGRDYSATVRALAEFLRSQQRPDGEFMHVYDRTAKRPVDIQLMYYSGEAAFALAKAHRLTHDPRDLEAARRALAVLVKRPFWYIAWHYYWAPEHWTCHALEELWDRAPNWDALKFCLEWQETVRNTSIFDREAAPQYDGANTSGPFVAPQVVISATRMEAGAATLAVARKEAKTLGRATVRDLEKGIRSTLGFMLGQQLLPGPKHIMPNPSLMRGGVPASDTDLKVRIDYPQHAGTAWLNYLRQLEAPQPVETP